MDLVFIGVLVTSTVSVAVAWVPFWSERDATKRIERLANARESLSDGGQAKKDLDAVLETLIARLEEKMTKASKRTTGVDKITTFALALSSLSVLFAVVLAFINFLEQ